MRQIQRWTIGAGEVFHYFMVKSGRIPTTAALTWAIRFLTYYGIILCMAPIFSLVAPLLSIEVMKLSGAQLTGLLVPDEKVFMWILAGILVLQYFWFAVVFLINKAAEPSFPDGMKYETLGFVTFFHLVSALPTIVGYCCIELWSFALLSIRGKSVCQHNPSKKDSLVDVRSTVSTIDLQVCLP